MIDRIRDWRPGALPRHVAVAAVSVAVVAVMVACGTPPILTCVVPKPMFSLVYFNDFDSCGISTSSDYVFAFDTQPPSPPTGYLRATFPTPFTPPGSPPSGMQIGGICYNVSPAPALADGMLFTGSDYGYLYALDTKTLTLRWQYLLPGNSTSQEFLLSTPAIARGIVYFTTYDGSSGTGLWIRALAYSPAGEKLLWSHPLPWNLCCALLWAQSSPTLANGVVYIGSETGLVFALDAATGTLKWQFKTLGATHTPWPQPVCSRPAVANGFVYVAGGDGHLYALDAATGMLRWDYDTGVLNDGSGGPNICGSPAVDNGTLYFAAVDGNVYALDAHANTPILRWRFTLAHHTHSSARVDHGILYIGTNAGELYALDANKGGVLWIYVTPTLGEIDSTPAVDNGTIYFGSEDHLVYAVNARSCTASGTPALTWSYDTGSPIIASPAFGR